MSPLSAYLFLRLRLLGRLLREIGVVRLAVLGPLLLLALGRGLVLAAQHPPGRRSGPEPFAAVRAFTSWPLPLGRLHLKSL